MEEGLVATPQNPFAQPGKNGDFFSPKHHAEWLDRLFIFYPDSSIMKTFDEKEGPKEFVIADVAIVDLVDPQTGQPVVLKGVSIGGVSLVPALNRDRIGTKVLARLRRGAPRGGNDGAYYLDAESLTPQDIAMGTAYDASHQRNQFTPPQGQQAPAPQQQYAPPVNTYGQTPGNPAAQPQYASQALPYDPWQGTQTAQPQAAPAGPPQGHWGAPAGTAQGAPAQTPPASPSAPQQWGQPAANGQAPAAVPAAAPQPSATTPLDPQLVAFLQSKGVPNVESMTDGQARMIASTFSA